MDTEIREAVRIIIERFRTHPEDFGDAYGSRFGWVFASAVRLKGEDFTDVLNEAEKAAIDEIYKDYKYRLFHARVMQSLLAEDAQYETRVEAQGKLTALPGGWVNAASQITRSALINTNQAQMTHSLDVELQRVKQQLMQVQGNSLKPTP